MTSPRPLADRVARRLLGYASGVVTSVGELDPYLRRYLPEHVGGSGLWDRLGERIDVLDRLDPDVVASEVMRTAGGLASLPVSILTTMVAHAELRSPVVEDRRLARALAASRLGLSDPAMTDPRLRWSRLNTVVPHLPFVGHTGGVNPGAVLGVLDGRALLASGRR